MELNQLLGKEALTIVEASMLALKNADMEPYKKSEPEENRRRFLTLIHLIIQGIEDKTLLPMQEYGAKVAKERYEKGYCLREVFTAFNLLEENIWKRLIEKTEPEFHGKHLGLVSTILSRGKEALALAYVDLAVDNPSPIRDYNELYARI